MTDTVDMLPADRIGEDYELLISVAARLNRMSAIVLSSLPVTLTFRQYRTLSRVTWGYTSLSQLAARGNLSLPTVSENVDGLVKRGLMTTTQSETDRRAIVLHVTDAGRAAVEAGAAGLSHLVNALLAELEPERRADLEQSLRIVYGSATSYFKENLRNN